MFSNSTKSTTVKTGRPAALQTTRNATAARGLNASRGLPVDAQAYSQAAQPSAHADRLGTAFTLLLSLALVAGGVTMIARI
jgi:hypothetical protein